MTTVTISDMILAVNKAFEAGYAKQAYEGLMPSAHDAGTHFADSAWGVNNSWGPDDGLAEVRVLDRLNNQIWYAEEVPGGKGKAKKS